MESAVVMSPPEHRHEVQRLPSLNNLLESEVILGDEDGSSSCDESEMHSAMEELSESTTGADSSSKFVDCSTRASSITDSVQETSNIPIAHVSLSQSYYKESEPPSSPVRTMVPRSSSTLSSRTLQSVTRSRLTSPRLPPNYAENTLSSKNRLASSPSPYAAKRSLSSAGQATAQPVTPVSARKPSTGSPAQRPAVPPKPANLVASPSSPASGLTRQLSNVKAKTPDSPLFARRSTSAAPAAARVFVAAGKQPSVVRSTTPKQSPPRPDDRFATLGRKAKPVSPVTTTASTPLDSSVMMKSTADKFATLPRRKIVKDRPVLPKSAQPESGCSAGGRSTDTSLSSSFSTGCTLPRPKKSSVTSPSSPAPRHSGGVVAKPRTLIYMEKSAQTELCQQDIRDGLEASLKLRTLSRQPHNDEIRQLEHVLQQSKEEAEMLQRELEEEREERQLVQRELERTTQRVAAMLDSMEGVEREFHSRGDSLLQLETNLQTSTRALCALQEQLEAQDAALLAQRLELDRSLLAEKTLTQQLSEAESESREMMEFLQAEKLALTDAVRDSDAEIQSLRAQLEESRKQFVLKEEECIHLVRLAEQRRHELAAVQADLKGAEGRTGSLLLAQGAQLSAAAFALSKLHSRMDGLLQSLIESHSLPVGELEAVVFPNEAYKPEDNSPSESDITDAPTTSPPVETSESSAGSSPPPERENDNQHEVPPPPAQVVQQRLAGSTSLQDLSDAINLVTRRRLAPEGREEPNPVVDEELRLAASLVDQIEDADHVLSKLLMVLRRLVLDKDSTMQKLNDEKEQLLASLSAQTNALQEAKYELNKLRLKMKDEEDDKQANDYQESGLKGSSLPDLKPFYGHWDDVSSAPVCWTKTVSQVLETLPLDVVRDHPPLQKLLQHLLSSSDFSESQDPNANGSG